MPPPDGGSGGNANGHTKKDAQRTPNGSEQHKNGAKTSKKSLLTRAKQLWAKYGVTSRQYQSMFKGALAPTIAISAFQATAWANQFTTVGYLIGVITILSIVIQPRAKFIQMMLMHIFLSCLACALIVLACFCCVRARSNTQSLAGPGSGGSGTSGTPAPGAATAQYNSSASAVAGVWLFAQIYAISVLRAKMPQYNVPCIMAAIITNVALTYAPQFSAMAQAEALVLQLLEAYLTAFAIATAVSLLIFPLTSRDLVFKDIETFISQLRSALTANLAYLNSLGETDMFAAQRTNTEGEKPFRSPEAEAFLAKVKGLAATQAKFSADIPFAKREVAWGKLGPDDLQKIFGHLRECTIPAVGLSCMSDIFERMSEDRGWDRSVSFANVGLGDAANEAEKARIETINEWHELIRLLKEPFGEITDLINDGLQHVAITLQFSTAAKSVPAETDSEAKGDTPKPGDQEFTAYFRQKAEDFQRSKQTMLRGWCRIHNIELPEDFFSNPQARDFNAPSWMNDGVSSQTRKHLRRQLMVLLYIEYLLYIMARRVHRLIEAAEGLEESGKLSQKRLIVPGYKRLRKWVYSSIFEQQDEHPEDYNEQSTVVQLGQAYNRRKDLEHLEPQTTWERLTNQLRRVPHFLSSPASQFGFRVACATMSIAIVNYLRDTQVFFTAQRLFWAQIMTSIAMSPSAGQSLRTLFLRIAGTFLAFVLSLIAYYIVDGETAGVIIFFFLFLHVGIYIMLKHPAIAPMGVITQVTVALILGYELQVRKLGVQVATSNGQAFYPVWELGLIRVATVAGGLFLAWIWTIFPYPITEHSQLRQNLGSTLYFVANYYSVVHETVQIRLAGAQGDPLLKDSPVHQLEKARRTIYVKCQTLLSGLRTQAGFVKYDIPVGGKFPLARYTEVIQNLQNVLNFMSLVSVASSSFTELDRRGRDQSSSEWLYNFRKIIGDANLTSQSVTTLLSLLSASVTSGNPLPPYLRIPEPYMLSDRLEKLDTDILSVRHVAEPGYASFAVIQIGTKSLLDDLKSLLHGVRELVGELDFSYHVISTSDASKDGLEETLTYTQSRASGQERNKQD
ncbi:hypothetical protein LTR37_011460 [Vermiconidia calcicola]|uniref:Uncharacterized protein n=1 Tax=Vermiconidia calcicola TaxID=1690605 RepID=A0ACC3N287_9PEZI|nr:hypothetical protein LTR37_011460 [Vermiconidia calcicola]